MKVLLVSNNLRIGGKEKQLYLLICELEKKSIDYRLLLRRNEIGFPVKRDRVKVLSDNSLWSNVVETRQFISEFKPDVVHSWEGYLSSILVLANLGLHAKFIDGSIRFAKQYPWTNSIRWRTWLVNKLASHTVANTEAGLKAFGFQPDHKCRVIPNGFEFNGITDISTRDESDSFVVGMVANFTKGKDFPSLIQAVERLLEKGRRLKLFLIGDGPLKSEYHKMVPDKWKPFFLFPGLQKEVMPWVKKFDVGVLLSKPGHSEGMSNAIMEYMACAKPVIATHTGGNPELVMGSVSGFLIGFEDVESLMGKIEFLMDNPEERRKMGARGREKVEKEHQLTIYGEKWVSLYREIV